MANSIKYLNEIFKEAYSEQIQSMFQDDFEYIIVKSTKLSRKLYAGKLGGFTDKELLVKRNNIESPFRRMLKR